MSDHKQTATVVVLPTRRLRRKSDDELEKSTSESFGKLVPYKV